MKEFVVTKSRLVSVVLAAVLALSMFPIFPQNQSVAFAEEHAPSQVAAEGLQPDGTYVWPSEPSLPSEDTEYAPSRLLVVFKRSISVEDARDALAGMPCVEGLLDGPELTDELISEQDFVMVGLAKSTDFNQAILTIFAHETVDWVQPDYLEGLIEPAIDKVALNILTLRNPAFDGLFTDEEGEVNAGVMGSSPYYPTDDPGFRDLSHLRQINVEGAWSYNDTRTEGRVAVAVLDTGVDIDHEDLKNNIRADLAMDFRDGEKLARGEPLDDHGTHVAGIISAEANNGIGVVGVSYNAQIIPINVFHPTGTDPKTYISDQTLAIRYVTELRKTVCPELRVINMSLGGHTDDRCRHRAIQKAWEAGILCVAAAGNNGGDVTVYPADHEECISVIALDEDGLKRRPTSNYGPPKDISAPGEKIPSTTLGSAYKQYSGTSMAAPMVSGAAALLFAKDDTLTIDEVKEALYATADNLSQDSAERSDEFGYGRLNVGAAIEYFYPPIEEENLEPPIENPDPPVEEEEPNRFSFTRLYGPDRFATMKAISEKRGTISSVAIVTSADNYPDALCASALAGIHNAPILLTRPEEGASLSPEARDEIRRLGITTVYITGGVAAVPTKAEEDLVKLLGRSNVIRYGGSDRYQTALDIYSESKSQLSDTAIVVSGSNFPDAISVSSLAYAQKYPLFLARDGVLDTSAVSAIQSGGFREVLIIGGTAVIDNAVMSQLFGIKCIRLAGDTRYKTSHEVATWSINQGYLGLENLALATGQNFPDALCGGALGGELRSVILLVADDADGRYCIENTINGKSTIIKRGYILGGHAAVTAATAAEAYQYAIS